MSLENLDILEEKINHAVLLIEKLKQDNETLRKEIDEVRAESQGKEERIHQLKEENNNLKLAYDESSLGKEKEEQIKSKVEQMLNKLNELHYL